MKQLSLLKKRFENFFNIETFVNVSILLAIVIFLLTYFKPSLLLSLTVTSGGDTASHYYPMEYLRDKLLSNGKIVGWCPGWYGGFPLFQYYFPLTFVIGAFLSYLIPIQVAFKIISILGVFLLPFAFFLSLKLMKFEFPIPILGAVLTLPFLFMEANSMWGGNIPSTLAGEFSYGFGLALCFAFFGLFYKGLKENKYWVANAILFSLIAFSHAITAIWVCLTTGIFFCVLFLKNPTKNNFKTNFKYFFKTYLLAFLLTAAWLLPMVLNIKYTTPYPDTWIISIDQIFPKTLLGPSLYFDLKNPSLNDSFHTPLPAYRFVSVLLILNLIALYISIKKRDDRLFLLYSAFFTAIVLFFLGETLGLVNIRFVPFMQTLSLILASIGLGYFLTRIKLKWLIPLIVVALVMYWVHSNTTYISFWIKWNYEGFEGKSVWPAYLSVNQLLKGDQSSPRVVYEHTGLHDQAGTTRAFESLPLFSGRSTLEGLYMQSSVSSPFIFYIQSEIGPEQSCPFYKNYKCTNFNLENGIEHLKMFNVQHYIVRTDEAKRVANETEGLKLVADIDPYQVYEVVDNENQYVIVPNNWPVETSIDDWKSKSYEWFKGNDTQVPIIFSNDYLPSVKRLNYLNDLPQVAINKECNIEEQIGDDTIAFKTNCIGLPHIIRISYHPNWQVEGAKKMYLVSPSFMLVIPEKEEVKLWFGYTWVNYLATLMTIVGVFAAIYFTFLNNQTFSKFLKR